MALLGLALLVRLLLAPFFGFYDPDVQDYVNWGRLMNQHPLDLYVLGRSGSADIIPVYPPLLLYLCGVQTGTYFGAAHLLGIPATDRVVQAPQLVAWMKMPAILFDVGTVTVLYLLARRT